VTSETLIAAITGATDNAVARRASDRATPPPDDGKIVRMRDLNARRDPGARGGGAS
jgi:hypothetical protein